MASRALFLAFAISAVLFLSAAFAAANGGAAAAAPDLDDEDLSFLEDGDEAAPSHGSDEPSFGGDGDELEDFDPAEIDYDEDGAGPHSAAEAAGAEIDESDVVVLAEGNFSEFLASHQHVMVEFYAPWCMHCQALAPEYAAAATALRGEDVALAKVDATEENDLAQRYEIQGFPTVLFFVDGVRRDYPGARSRDAIVTWIKKKIGPGVQNITTVDEAEKILTSEDKVVLGFLDSLV